MCIRTVAQHREEGGREIVIAPGKARVAAIGGINKLHQVIGADGDEIHFWQQPVELRVGGVDECGEASVERAFAVRGLQPPGRARARPRS